jgi:hypothetical protein
VELPQSSLGRDVPLSVRQPGCRGEPLRTRVDEQCVNCPSHATSLSGRDDSESPVVLHP